MKNSDWVKLIQVVVLCLGLVACGPSQELDTLPTLVVVDVVKEREIDEVAQVEPTALPAPTDTAVPTAAVTETPVVTNQVITVVPQVVYTIEPTVSESTPTSAQATATVVSFPVATPIPTSSPVQSQSIDTPLPTGVWPTATPVAPTATSVASVPTATSVFPDVVPTATPAATPAATDTLTGAWPTNTPQPTDTPWPTNTPRPIPPTNTPWPTSLAPSSGDAPAGGGQSGRGNARVNAVPGNPTSYLSNFQMITFYGSPYGRALGILGNQARTQTDIMLQEHADMFQPLDSRHAIPTYHMVTTVANVTPPRYSHHAGMDIIEEWVAAAEENGYGAILDVQPGHVDVVEELNRVRHLLYKPHVHFAIDPEFMMGPGQVPGVYIGRATADEINRIQAQLHQIALETGVKKVLMVHQFKDSMIVDKENIVNYSGVELLIDSDGAFSTAVKTNSYLQYASEPGFEFGGIKYFYEYDDYIPTASEIMSLQPRPAIIIYQ